MYSRQRYDYKKIDDDFVDEFDSFCVCQFCLVILLNVVIYMLLQLFYIFF